MNLLLDTHAFLWFMEGSERISQRARDGIEAAGGVRALSVASACEMAIKTSLGKLALAKPLGELLPPLLADSGIELLPIEVGTSRASLRCRFTIAIHSIGCSLPRPSNAVSPS
jgi:PIN domain nuclease of toxin-antitoxin system